MIQSRMCLFLEVLLCFVINIHVEPGNTQCNDRMLVYSIETGAGHPWQLPFTQWTTLKAQCIGRMLVCSIETGAGYSSQLPLTQ